MRSPQWILDNCQFDGKHAADCREGILHTYAVARLRQGRFDEVERLCQGVLSHPELSPANRATTLATIVLVRRALGQPYEGLLVEAQMLDPDADLVKEASAATA